VDLPTGIALDGEGNIVVAGTTDVDSGRGFTTIKYEEERTVATEQTRSLPLTLLLEQNYPNPFNPRTVIRYYVPHSGDVRLVVYDMTGREVARPVDGQTTAGTHAVTFDASHLASGFYVYRLTATMETVSRKMIVLR